MSKSVSVGALYPEVKSRSMAGMWEVVVGGPNWVRNRSSDGGGGGGWLVLLFGANGFLARSWIELNGDSCAKRTSQA